MNSGYIPSVPVLSHVDFDQKRLVFTLFAVNPLISKDFLKGKHIASCSMSPRDAKLPFEYSFKLIYRLWRRGLGGGNHLNIHLKHCKTNAMS